MFLVGSLAQCFCQYSLSLNYYLDSSISLVIVELVSQVGNGWVHSLFYDPYDASHAETALSYYLIPYKVLPKLILSMSVVQHYQQHIPDFPAPCAAENY